MKPKETTVLPVLLHTPFSWATDSPAPQLALFVRSARAETARDGRKRNISRQACSLLGQIISWRVRIPSPERTLKNAPSVNDVRPSPGLNCRGPFFAPVFRPASAFALTDSDWLSASARCAGIDSARRRQKHCRSKPCRGSPCPFHNRTFLFRSSSARRCMAFSALPRSWRVHGRG